MVAKHIIFFTKMKFTKNEYITIGNYFIYAYSLSRREESWENKLSACLLACVSAGSKEHRLVTIFIRVDRRVIGVKESESSVSFLKFFFGSVFYTKDHFFYEKNVGDKG